LWFAGLDDLWYGQPDLRQALSGVPSQTEATIVLTHNPLLFDPLAMAAPGQVDLVLAGHTHAGHVYIPVLGPIYRRIFRMKYRYGLYKKQGSQLYVTSGVGSAAFYLKKRKLGFPRFRFNTYPEIAILTLVRA
jgi:predicted MPP superfamily phosphohydrolase